MPWVRVDAGAGPQVGVLGGEGVHLLPAGVTMLSLLTSGDLGAAAAEARAAAPVPIGDVAVLAPLPDPPSIRDFMVFEQHVEGMAKLVGAGVPVPPVWYRQPLFYFSNPASVTGPYDDIPIPPGCEVFDAELEVAVVIGSGGRDFTLSEAENAIAGYMILNDWSARDLQAVEMTGPLGPCKGKDSAITLGPLLVTPDELESRRTAAGYDLGLSWRINGEEIGADQLTSMAWSFAEMVAYASRGTVLRPGDVLGSGTCGGGCLGELWGRQGREARAPLRPGDLVELIVDELGATANRVVAGAPVRQPLTPRVSPS